MDDFDDIQCEEFYGEEWDGDETEYGVDADREAFASAGWGTDEDYGGTTDDWMEG